MRWLSIAFVIAFLAVWVFATGDMPNRADPNAPASNHVSPEMTVMTEDKVGIPNVVSAVLADFRGYDTLGETTVILTAGFAVLLVLQRGVKRR